MTNKKIKTPIIPIVNVSGIDIEVEQKQPENTQTQKKDVSTIRLVRNIVIGVGLGLLTR
jgi:hypothetical protein